MTQDKAQIPKLFKMAVRFSSRNFVVGHFQGKYNYFELFLITSYCLLSSHLLKATFAGNTCKPSDSDSSAHSQY